MSQALLPSQALAFCSLLFREDKFSISEVTQIIEPLLGTKLMEYHHSYFPMKDYYEAEMGEASKLSRLFLVSENLSSRESFVSMKYLSLELEKKYSSEGKRHINIDYGLILPENLILSTFKSYSHRQYIGKGVYSELVYQFKEGTYEPLPWCYPDYQHRDIISAFEWFRSFLMTKL